MQSWRRLRAYLLQIKPDDLCIQNQARMTHTTHHHGLSSCFHTCIYATFTCKKGAWFPAASHHLIDVTVHEGAPLYQGLYCDSVSEARFILKVLKFSHRI